MDQNVLSTVGEYVVNYGLLVATDRAVSIYTCDCCFYTDCLNWLLLL